MLTRLVIILVVGLGSAVTVRAEEIHFDRNETRQERDSTVSSLGDVSTWISNMLPVVQEVYLDRPENLSALKRVLSSEPLMTNHLAALDKIINRDVLADYPAPTLNAIADLANFAGLDALLRRFPEGNTPYEWIGPATELVVLAEFHRQGTLTSLPKLHQYTDGAARVEVDGLISDANGEQFLEIKRLGASTHNWTWKAKTALDQTTGAANLLRKPGLLVFAISAAPQDRRFMAWLKGFLSTRPQNRMPLRVAYLIAPLHKPVDPPVRLLFEPTYLQFTEHNPGSPLAQPKPKPDAKRTLSGRPPPLGRKIISSKAMDYQRFIGASLGSVRSKGRVHFR